VLNHERCHWKVLPQDMANSPTLCQAFVATALLPLRQKFDQACIIHYMDDIVLSHPRLDILQNLLAQICWFEHKIICA
jgi:hypothetical protein